MPAHLRALVVILAIGIFIFLFAKGSACAIAMREHDFQRRRNLWFAITLIAFLAHDFWVYIVGVAFVLLATLPREQNKLALYFFLLFAVPPIQAQVSGFGVIQHFFVIHYLRLLALIILFTAFLSLREQKNLPRIGSTLTDKLVIGYLVLQFGLLLSVSTFTNTLRSGVFYSFIDVFLPYYVASRSIRNLGHFRDTLMSFVVAALIVGSIGVFEFSRHWLLYSVLDNALGVPWSYGGYLTRNEGGLRAQGSTGQPIPLGYVMAVALGCYFFLRESFRNSKIWGLGLLGLIAGLIAPLSRGPWVGAAVMLALYIMTGPRPIKRALQIGLASIVALPVMGVLPGGEKILELMPFVETSTEAAATVTYRQRLLEIGVNVILQNPLFGAYNYFFSPAMQELAHGNGLIDLVNSYLAVALSSGLVGLSLFLGAFLAAGSGVFMKMRQFQDVNSEARLLGRVLLSCLAGIMVTIFTTSSITVIPVIYWAFIGLCVAYTWLEETSSMKSTAEANNPPSTDYPPVRPVAPGSYAHYSRHTGK